MTKQVASIRRMQPGEEGIVCRLAVEVFSEFVAPLYSQEGASEFLRYIDPDLMSKRAKSNHFVLMAESNNELVGIIEVRDFNHISLLFVLREAQRKGVANQLLDEALETCLQQNPNMPHVTVHSSPNSVEAYEHLGFRSEGEEEVDRGIRYIPMKLQFQDNDDG